MYLLNSGLTWKRNEQIRARSIRPDAGPIQIFASRHTRRRSVRAWLEVAGISAMALGLSACSGTIGSPFDAATTRPTLTETVPLTDASLISQGWQASWMAANAKSQNLLYVTNYSYATVYSYPQGRLLGTLTGFKSAVGACVDKKGNVFITNHIYHRDTTRIAEYAHGGDKPIALLANDKHIGPLGCSVDPTSNDLAVSGGGSARGAGVDIFRGAKGKPSFVKIPQMVFTQFCGFDDRGDLFVDGLKDFSGTPALAELRKGAHRFVELKLDAVIDPEGGVQWDGKHLAIGAYIPPNGSNATPVILRFSINGTRGTKVGTTKLGSPAHLTSFQFFISDHTVIVPNWYYASSLKKFNVLFFKYPAGGLPIMTLTKHISAPRGTAVSLASGSNIQSEQY